MLHDSNDVSGAVAALRAGAVIAYPTEAVFGLGCDPFNEAAVADLFTLKARPTDFGLVLIGARYAQLERFIGALSDDAIQRMASTWPGPHTWVVPRSATTPSWLIGCHAGIAIRVTAHPLAAQLCEAFGGALVSTSANVHGEAPARDVAQVRSCFRDTLGYILAGAVGGLERPTPIRDAVSGNLIRA